MTETLTWGIGPLQLVVIGRTSAAGDRTNIGAGNRTNIGAGDRSNTNINIGEVNTGNRVNYASNRQGWVDERHNWGNSVRGNVGNRYGNAFTPAFYGGLGGFGGYNYYNSWGARGPNFGYSPATWAGLGVLFGASMANAQPVYYGYGNGGNVYYEGDTVYVDGTAIASAPDYAAQAAQMAQAAPPVDQVNAEQPRNGCLWVCSQ